MGKRKRVPAVSVVLEGLSSGEYSNYEGTSNALLLPAKEKPNKGKESEINQTVKSIRYKKMRLDKIEMKQSKTQLKKLAKIVERKQKKESRSSLLESLREYQLPQLALSELSSTAYMQRKSKNQKYDQAPVFPKKLNSLAGREKDENVPGSIICSSSGENYYETGSESESDVEMNKNQPKSLQSGRDIDECATVLDIHEELSTVLEISTCNPEGILLANDAIEFNEISNICSSEEDSIAKIKNARKTEAAVRMTKTIDLNTVMSNERKFVLVERTAEVLAQRAKLPIFGEEQVIMEKINENSAIIICGETGSGKTTQLPQFLYEAGYTSNEKIIGITEPRRVAAISMANRVGYEMNLSDIVSYQIRYEGTRSSETRILFMTDGVLMKEIQKDIMLSSYSVIIIDEAHERSMYSDVLIGLLSRVAPYRTNGGSPLKLIIMSATLSLEHFTQKTLFPRLAPSVINVDSRQYPVTVHFERRTQSNYLLATFRKICKIHENLPFGSILVFLSGRQEVETLLNWLVSRYPIRGNKPKKKFIRSEKQMNSSKQSKISERLVQSMDERNIADEFDTVDVIADDIMDEKDLQLDGDGMEPPMAGTPPLFCLPLFSLLSSAKQKRIFDEPPAGCRVCIIATNVAETSITIPAIRYVVDSGREKRRVYDPITGISRFIVHWISQASAEQRTGRAGRVQAGHAYRLYSSAVYADLEEFTPPEIVVKPVDQLVLQMKSMNIIKICNFPFPTPPDRDALEESEKRLLLLGAMSVRPNSQGADKEARINEFGRTLSLFPVAPRYAKILAMANQHDLLALACLLVSILSVREPMIPLYSLKGSTNEETQAKMMEALKKRRAYCSTGQPRRFGDLTVLLKAVLASLVGKGADDICEDCGVRAKVLNEIKKLRHQLTNLINSLGSTKEPLSIDPDLSSLSDKQFRMLRQIVIASLTDNVVRRVDRVANSGEVRKGAYESQKIKEHLFIDPSSMLYNEEPEWLLYQEIIERNGKKCMQNNICVEPEWLHLLAPNYCNFTDIKDVEPRYDERHDDIVVDCNAFFGDRNWSLDVVCRPVPKNINLYRNFARFFLDGSICPKLMEYASKLLISPATMTRPWAKLHTKTEVLLNALIQYEVCSRKSLEDIWLSKHEYLLEEYLEWIPQSLHSSIQLMWPPL